MQTNSQIVKRILSSGKHRPVEVPIEKSKKYSRFQCTVSTRWLVIESTSPIYLKDELSNELIVRGERGFSIGRSRNSSDLLYKFKKRREKA